MSEFLRTMTGPLMLPISIALLGGTLAYVISRASPALCRLLALAGSAGALAAVLVVRGGAAPFTWEWTKLTKTIALSVDLSHSVLGTLVAGGSAAFALLITVYSLRAMAGRYWEGKFYAYLLWALAGACIVALAGNLLVLLVGWEIVTLMLFLMINQGRGNAKAGAAKAYGMLGFADACLLLAVVLLMSLPDGSKNLSLAAGARSAAEMGATGYLIYVLILIAALAKAGGVPLHSWIPTAATDAPTPVTAFLPGSLDKLLGIYLLTMVALRMFAPDAAMGVVLLVVGVATLLGAGLMAVMQSNVDRALAFDAVSQVGYMCIGIGAGVWLLAAGGSEKAALAAVAIAGGLFHMLNHAIYKSGLFLMSGVIRRAGGTSEMKDMGGLARAIPVTFVCGTVLALSAAGVPPLNGFFSKWLVFQGALSLQSSGGMVVLVAAVFASALSMAVFVKILYSAFLSDRPAGAPAPAKGGETAALVAPLIVLAVCCVLAGVFPGAVINGALRPTVEQVAPTDALEATLAGVNTKVGVWSPSQATGLILIGLALGLIFAWLATGGLKVRVVRPFIGGEVPGPGDDRFRVPGTHFFETIGKLPVIGALLREGERSAFDVYYWSGKHGHTLVEVLRAQHTGLLSLYVAWGLLGLVVTMVYLLVTMGT